MTESSWYIVGVDPAPSKDTVVCHGNGRFDRLPPPSLRAWFHELLESHENVLIAWDGPLGFDSDDFYDRKIDKAARKWISSRVGKGKIEEKAVNVRQFAGLPHWAISCHAVGHPFGTTPSQLRLVERVNNGHCLIEVHPAVALAVWWTDRHFERPLKRYKSNKKETAIIAESLGFPSQAGTDDDHLDAYVAFKLAEMLLQSEARWVGSALFGGYVLPDCSESDAIEAFLLAEKNL
jgi:hypothetical protein